MKHVRTFNEQELELVGNTIEDMALDLKDTGLDIKVLAHYESVFIKISGGDRKYSGFKVFSRDQYKELEEFLIKANGYLLDSGFFMHAMSHSYVDELYCISIEDARTDIKSLLSDIANLSVEVTDVSMYYTDLRGNK